MPQGDALLLTSIVLFLLIVFTNGEDEEKWKSFIDRPALKSYRDDVPKKKTLEMSFEDANIHLNDKQNDLETENVKMTEKIEIVGISTTIRTPSLVKRLVKISPRNFHENSGLFHGNTSNPCDLKLGCDNNEKDAEKVRFLPAFFEPILSYLREEIWVVPIVLGSTFLTLGMIIFEIYLLAQVVRSSRRHQYPSRRHLFLGQMLILGLILCCSAAVSYSLKPTKIVCSLSRISCGLSFSLVYSTMLVKLVFLISLNSGVYLPATYQALLLCFAVLIQLVIGIQWLVSSPADLVTTSLSKAFPTKNFTNESEEVFTSCNTTFQQELLGLLYVFFLVIVVVVLAFKARGVRENYRESMYIALTMAFTVCIFLIWILAGLILPISYQDLCKSCGLVASSAITFIIMFMPKGRQLSAMGKEGVYSEDRTDVYGGTDSSTQSTASCATSHEGGTLSPSFFPVQPSISKDLVLVPKERFGTPQSTERLKNLSPTYEQILCPNHLFSSDQNFTGNSPTPTFYNKPNQVKRHLSQKHLRDTNPKTMANDSDQIGLGWRKEKSYPVNMRKFSGSWTETHYRPHQFISKSKKGSMLWKPSSQRDIPGAISCNSASEFWHWSSSRLDGGYRSTYDLHAANESRASRNDLQEFRDRLMSRRSSHQDDVIDEEDKNNFDVNVPIRTLSRLSVQ